MQHLYKHATSIIRYTLRGQNTFFGVFLPNANIYNSIHPLFCPLAQFRHTRGLESIPAFRLGVGLNLELNMFPFILFLSCL